MKGVVDDLDMAIQTSEESGFKIDSIFTLMVLSLGS